MCASAGKFPLASACPAKHFPWKQLALLIMCQLGNISWATASPGLSATISTGSLIQKTFSFARQAWNFWFLSIPLMAVLLCSCLTEKAAPIHTSLLTPIPKMLSLSTLLLSSSKEIWRLLENWASMSNMLVIYQCVKFLSILCIHSTGVHSEHSHAFGSHRGRRKAEKVSPPVQNGHCGS